MMGRVERVVHGGCGLACCGGEGGHCAVNLPICPFVRLVPPLPSYATPIASPIQPPHLCPIPTPPLPPQISAAAQQAASSLGLQLDKTVKLEWHRFQNQRTRCLRITAKEEKACRKKLR